MDQVSLLTPGELALTEAESRAPAGRSTRCRRRHHLHYTARPLAGPGRAAARPAHGVAGARAVSRPDARCPDGRPDAAQGARLRRLQSECRCCCTSRPSTTREAARRCPVNAVWIEGAGALDAPVATRPQVRTDTRLQAPPASTADYRRAWQASTARRSRLRAAAWRQPVQLTLCGAQRAITLATCTASLIPSFLNKMRPCACLTAQQL
jgi:hypothetical protein